MAKPIKTFSPKGTSGSASSRYWILFAIALAAMALFVAMSLSYDFTQDDAYISFRYAVNFLDGKGLVYNVGERVEGYTNFPWVVLMSLFKGLFGIERRQALRADQVWFSRPFTTF